MSELNDKKLIKALQDATYLATRNGICGACPMSFNRRPDMASHLIINAGISMTTTCNMVRGNILDTTGRYPSCIDVVGYVLAKNIEKDLNL